MKVLENAGHINTSSGYGEWLWVKEWVNLSSSSGSTRGSILKENNAEIKLDSRLRGNDGEAVDLKDELL